MLKITERRILMPAPHPAYVRPLAIYTPAADADPLADLHAQRAELADVLLSGGVLQVHLNAYQTADVELRQGYQMPGIPDADAVDWPTAYEVGTYGGRPALPVGGPEWTATGGSGDPRAPHTPRVASFMERVTALATAYARMVLAADCLSTLEAGHVWEANAWLHSEIPDADEGGVSDSWELMHTVLADRSHAHYGEDWHMARSAVVADFVQVDRPTRAETAEYADAIKQESERNTAALLAELAELAEGGGVFAPGVLHQLNAAD